MTKISSMQFMTLLICSKLFCIMTYIPAKDENGLVFILTEISGSLLLAVLILPAIVFYNKHRSQNILDFASSKSRTLAVFLSVFYLMISLFSVIRVMGDLTFFLRYCFTETYTPWAVIIVISAAAFYISSLNLPTLARVTGIVVVLIFVGLLLVFSGFQHHIDLIELNLAVDNPAGMTLNGIPRLLSNSYEMIAFVLLMNSLKNKPAKTMYRYLTIKAVIVSLTIFAVTVVLGDFAHLSKLPFFSLSVFSQTKIIEHFEAFFMLFWTLAAVIKITLFTFCATTCIQQMFPVYDNTLIANGAALAISAVSATVLITFDKWESIRQNAVQGLLVLIGFFVVPTIMLIFKNRHKKYS